MEYLRHLPCKIGCHVGKEDVVKTAEELFEVGAKAIQIYLSNKISFNPGKSLTKEEVKDILYLRKKKDLYVVVHGKLILNLCQDDMRNIPALTCDILEAAKINADVVIHQGKNVNKLSREEALSRYVLNVIEAIDQTAGIRTKIILENSCQQGTELGFNLDDLVTIWRLLGASEINPVHTEGYDEEQALENKTEDEVVDSKLPKLSDDDDDDGPDRSEKPWRLTNYQQRIGFCLDLCHAHVGGMINMRDPDNVTQVLEEFHKKIGLENLTVIHFNDSEIKFDGHNDSHADILMGQIGNPDEPIGGNSLGFRKIVEYACRYKIPMILETPGKVPMSLQIALIQGWALQEYGLDIEDLYLQKTQQIRDTFANDPRSRKGRKKVVPVVAKVNPIATSTPVTKPKVATAPKPLVILKKTKDESSSSSNNTSLITKKPILKIIPLRRTPSTASQTTVSVDSTEGEKDQEQKQDQKQEQDQDQNQKQDQDQKQDQVQDQDQDQDHDTCSVCSSSYEE